MKSLLFYSLILFGFLSVKAQVRIISHSSHTTSHNGPELSVYQNTNFTMGSGASCPPLDSAWISRTGNTIVLDMLFNALVPLPAFGCSRMDTIIDTISPCRPCELIVNAHAIYMDTVGFPPPMDTLWNQDNDTSYFSYLSSAQYKIESDFEVYPNPASGFLYLKGEGLQNSVIKLLDISGREVRSYEDDSSRLSFQGIKSGIYFLAIERGDGSTLARKVIIE
ncbi:T9SS type A sorting domain-containing protein [Owenweeksia hongkongensis]|uniref:T9SS type A sorting domain-containing protein n=1 Tax=Owenweeksia hongkongensis TaxID=253245 RepID=UPI003A8DEFC8